MEVETTSQSFFDEDTYLEMNLLNDNKYHSNSIYITSKRKHYEDDRIGSVNMSSMFIDTNEGQSTSMYASLFSLNIENKLKYLTNLDINDDWISGNSVAPSRESINVAISVIENFKNWYLAKFKRDKIYPKFIISPIPIGGIHIEIRTPSSNKLFLNFYNSSLVEAEVIIQDYYYEIDLNENDVNLYVNQNYSKLLNG